MNANLDGVQVTMDGSEVGRTPLSKPLFVEPGLHTFKVTRPGYQSELRTISVEADRDVVLRFTLVAEPVAPVEPAPGTQTVSARPIAAEGNGIQPRAWVLIGGSAATAIGVGVGIAYRIRASSLGSDANSTLAQLDGVSAPSQVASHGECVTPTGIAQSLCEQLHSTLVRKDSATNISTGVFVTAGVLGIATVATYFFWPEAKSSGKQSITLKLAPMSLGKSRACKSSQHSDRR